MISFALNPQTIYLFIGPTGSGKTFFAENYLLPELKRHFRNVHHVSSDTIRRQLLGGGKTEEWAKYDERMLQVSGGAFSLLFSISEQLMSFPINADAVIVDTTGLSQDFRTKVFDLANTYQYRVEPVIFRYKNRDEHFQYPSTDKRIAGQQLNRVNEELYRSLAKEKANKGKQHLITTNNFETIAFVINEEEHTVWEKSQGQRWVKGDDNVKYTFIGDVHGQLGTLKALVQKLGFSIDEYDIIQKDSTQEYDHVLVLVGDLIDKGPQSGEVVDFVWKNQHIFILIKANHEHFVLQYLKENEGARSVPQDVLDTYFNSIPHFTAHEEHRKKLQTLYNNALPFLWGRNFIVTHSPCSNTLLGKMTPLALRDQRNHRYIRQEGRTHQEYIEALENDLRFITNDAVMNHPYHIFGHVTLGKVLQVKNKIGIDTGCGSGGVLSAVTLSPNIKRLHFTHVPTNEVTPLFPIIFEHNTTKAVEAFFQRKDIDPRDYRRLKNMVKNKVNYVSGTMCPVDTLDGELESLVWGLKYYRDRGYSEVMLQTKWMGSRCTVYIFRDLELCYAISRGGYYIRPTRIDLTHIFRDLQEKHLTPYPSRSFIILDGELLPWSVLGQDLIADTFGVYATCSQRELENMEKWGFLSILEEAKKALTTVDFSLGKMENKKIHGDMYYTTAEAIQKFPFPEMKNLHEGLKTFQEQLSLFGVPLEGEANFMPFNVLKTGFQDGTESVNRSQFQGFYQVCPQAETVSCRISLDNMESAKIHAQDFWEVCVGDSRHEGVVIKPDVVVKGVAPYLKVRNNDYLTLVYGYDWQTERKKQRLIQRKKIAGKLRLSIDEWETGQELLKIPYTDLSLENREYLYHLSQFIIEETKEHGLDPRL